MSETAPLGRDDLIRRVHARLMARTAPRLELLLIVLLAGAAAFFASVVSLNLGLTAMAWRYPIAVAAGYLTFIALIRVWIAFQRRRPDAGDLVDAADVASQPLQEVPAVQLGRGREPSFSGLDLSPSWDDLWPLAVALIVIGVAAFAIMSVIYAAPLLLAEVALDAAIVGTLYRRLRREDSSHWVFTVVRRTWLPALLLIALAASLGYLLQAIAPGARSIGGVLAALSPR